MKKIIDYLYEKDHRIVSLIGDCEKEFDFMCLHNIKIAKALGFKTSMVAENLEKVVPVKIESVYDIYELRSVTNFDYRIFQKEFEVIKAKKLITDKPLGGGCFGPLTIASDILGVDKFLRLTYKNPMVLEELLNYINEYLIELARMEETAGADFFWIAEPLASLLSPDNFWRFSGKHLNKIYNSINVPGFLHVCGKTTNHTPFMLKTNAQVLSIDYITDICHCMSMVPEDVTIMGNLNPMIIWMGTDEEIANEVNSINEKMRNYKNFIFSTGCSVPPGTLKEKMELVNNLVKKYPMKSNDEYRLIRRIISKSLDGDKHGLYELIANMNIDEILFDEACSESKIINKYNHCISEDLLDDLFYNVKKEYYGVDISG